MSFHVTGALVMLSGLLGIPLKFVNEWEKQKNTKSRQTKVEATANPHKTDVPLVRIVEETAAE